MLMLGAVAAMLASHRFQVQVQVTVPVTLLLLLTIVAL